MNISKFFKVLILIFFFSCGEFKPKVVSDGEQGDVQGEVLKPKIESSDENALLKEKEKIVGEYFPVFIKEHLELISKIFLNEFSYVFNTSDYTTSELRLNQIYGQFVEDRYSGILQAKIINLDFLAEKSAENNLNTEDELNLLNLMRDIYFENYDSNDEPLCSQSHEHLCLYIE